MGPGLIRLRVVSFLFTSVVAVISLAAAQEARPHGFGSNAVLSSSAQTATPSASGQADSAQSAATDKEEATAASDRVIMKVGKTQITEREFESSIGEIEPKGDPDKGAAEKDRRRLGSDYASVLILSQQALANRLEASPEVRQKLAVARVQILSDAYFAQLLSQTTPSPEEISRYYEGHLSEFDRVRIRRLFIWKVGGGSKNTRGLAPEEAKARAAAILQESASRGDAAKMAEMFRDGDQGILDAEPLIFVRGQLPAALDKAAFTMKPGLWAPAEDTADHIILIYLAGRDREPLSEVTAQIGKLVQGEKMQATLDELKKKSGIWMDEKYFGSGSAIGKESEERRPVAGAASDARN